MLLQKHAVQDAKNGLLQGILSPSGDLNFAAFLGSELRNRMLANFKEINRDSIITLTVEGREVRLNELTEQWPNSRFLRTLFHCPFSINLVRSFVAMDVVYTKKSGISKMPSPLEGKAIPIGNWKYQDLFVRFSEKPLTYFPEVLGNYLKHNSEISHRSILKDHEGLVQAVQAVDILLPSKLRKIYALKGDRKESYDYFDSENPYSNSYYFHVFGFALN